MNGPRISHHTRLALLELWGEFLVIAEQPERALEPLTTCWELRREMHTAGHWWPAYVSSLLAEALLGSERFEEAEELLLAAYPAMVAGRGGDHHMTARVVLRLVRLYDAWGRPEAAAQWRTRVPAARPSPVYRLWVESTEF